jgi:two-component system nitrate/nitrite response regulator NarL
MPASALSIVIASNEPEFRDRLKSHFERENKVHIVGCIDNPNDVLPHLRSTKAKLVVLDLDLGFGALCSLLDKIHSKTSAKSLIISDSIDRGDVVEVLRHGAHGVTSRKTPLDLMSRCVDNISKGGYWVSRDVVADFVNLIRNKPANDHGEETDDQPEPVTGENLGLTRREMQVIEALADGQTNKDIASAFSITEFTVKRHLTNIYDKVGVHNRIELLLFAMSAGLCSSAQPQTILNKTRG